MGYLTNLLLLNSTVLF